jgi:hypothetical protein
VKDEPKYEFKDSGLMLTAGTMHSFWKPNVYDCPKCGTVTSVIDVHFGNADDLDGKYCQQCYIRWMKEFVPKVTVRTEVR